MNLIQIQERLKDLPSSPQTMQALMAYANGASPAVPPYLALGELNRRKQIMEKAQMQQPPQGTVKDQVAQSAGIMALQQGRQQQGLQQMAQGMGQQMGQVPSQVAQAGPVQMARGGIVAFQSAGSVDDKIREMAQGQEESADYGATDTSAKALLAQALRDAAIARNAPKPETREQIRARQIKENPERYGILNLPIGDTATKNLELLQQAQRAELEKQKEESARLRPGILQQLGQAAAATRGRSGRDAFASILGGYADISSKADAEAVKSEQARRAKELEMMQTRFELQGKIEDLKRARAEGDVKAEQEDLLKLAEFASKNGLDVAKVLAQAGATAAQIEHYRATEAGSAEQRAETKRSNEAQERIARDRLNVDRARLDRDRQEALRLRVEQQLASENMFKNAMMMSAMLEMKPKRTPEEEAQLKGYQDYMNTRREQVENKVYGTKAAAPGGSKTSTSGWGNLTVK